MIRALVRRVEKIVLYTRALRAATSPRRGQSRSDLRQLAKAARRDAELASSVRSEKFFARLAEQLNRAADAADAADAANAADADAKK